MPLPYKETVFGYLERPLVSGSTRSGRVLGAELGAQARLPVAALAPAARWLAGPDRTPVGPVAAAPPAVELAWDVSLGPEPPERAEPACPGVTELAPLADWDD